MKKKYLDRLSEELDKVHANHKDDILEKYKKRYDFGLEAGMKEADIEEMLRDPEEVAKKYEGKDPFTSDGFNKNYNLSIKTVSDDIVIKKSKDDKAHVFFDDCDADDIVLTTVSGDIFVDKIRSVNFSTSSVSGDIEANHIDCETIIIDTISGDATIKETNGKIKTSSISGSIYVNGTECGNMKTYVKGIFKK